MANRISTQMALCMDSLARVAGKAIEEARPDGASVAECLLDLHSEARWYFRERAKPLLDRLLQQHSVAADGPTVAAVRRAIAEAIQRGAPQDLVAELRQNVIVVKGGAEGQLCDDSGKDLFEVIAGFIPKPAATAPSRVEPAVADPRERIDTIMGELGKLRDSLTSQLPTPNSYFPPCPPPNPPRRWCAG